VRRLAIVFVVLAGSGSSAQTGRPVSGVAASTFDAASIKPSDSSEGGSFRDTVRRFISVNQPLLALITFAYDLRDFQLEGLPDWVKRDGYDVTAVPPAGTTVSRATVQRLLEERFALRTRRETRQLPVYALVRSREDGRLGRGLQPSSNPCIIGQTDFPPCTLVFGPDRVVTIGSIWSANLLTGQITASANRIVVDRTGLTGRYDITLRWTPELATGRDVVGDDRISLFTALQEQLGLKLEPDTGPVEILVIESVSRPTPD
jgi:uncharacterized protein (TIGR03435 family)